MTTQREAATARKSGSRVRGVRGQWFTIPQAARRLCVEEWRVRALVACGAVVLGLDDEEISGDEFQRLARLFGR